MVPLELAGAKESRNLGIITAMTIFFTITYLLASEYVSSKKSKGEVLSYQRGTHSPKTQVQDIEKSIGYSKSEHSSVGVGEISEKIDGTLHRPTSVFQWRNICYDIKIKKEERRILDRVDGWVKPGTLTALMVSLLFPLIYSSREMVLMGRS